VKSTLKAQTTLTDELLCVCCGREMTKDNSVFQYGGPITFACEVCATKYVEHAYGIEDPKKLFRVMTPDRAMNQRIRLGKKFR